MCILSSSRAEPATVNLPLTGTENRLVNVTVATWRLPTVTVSGSATWTKQTEMLLQGQAASKHLF